MKRKLSKSKPKASNSSDIEPEVTISFTFSTEEVLTTMTLASIMTKENVDRKVDQTIDVNTADTSGDESKCPFRVRNQLIKIL